MAVPNALSMVVALVMLAASSGPGLSQDRGRLAPPAEVKCPADKLTVFAGQVRSMTIEGETATLTIATDWNTIEKVTLPTKRDLQLPLFLKGGRPFRTEDFKSIFVAEGETRPGIRAHAWVCSDGKHQPIVDWQPPRE
jgi:hypothetical protein